MARREPVGRSRRSGRRRPGRPSKRVLGRERIAGAALRVLERRGIDGFTLRAVAGELGVDVMALYHYFADKDALLRAAAVLAYSRLDPRAGVSGSWRRRLESLATAYVRMLGRSGELLRYLTGGSDALPEAVHRFEARFRAAVAPLALSARHYQAAHFAYVDFLHGFALGAPGGRLTPMLLGALRAELGVVFAGMQALARG